MNTGSNSPHSFGGGMGFGGPGPENPDPFRGGFRLPRRIGLYLGVFIIIVAIAVILLATGFFSFDNGSFTVSSDIFSSAATWIIILIIVGVLAVLLFVYAWWRKAKEQKNFEARQAEAMLNIPLEKFGDSRVQEIENKYDDNSNT